MDLKEAAEFLGISTRQVENYAAQGMLTRRKIKSGRTYKNVFERAELERLKARLAAEIVTPSVEQPETVRNVPQRPETATALQRSEPVRTLQPADLAPIAETLRMIFEAVRTDQAADAVNRRLDTIADEVRKLRRDDHPPVADLAHKLTLTTTDAATLSGLSLAQVRAALRTGELPSIGRGRSRRVKRADLDEWVAGL